jgi:hypothetical protein
MSEPWQKPLIARCKQSVREILAEIEAANDLDLWEEIDGKATDVILVYRQALKAKAEPTTFTFSDYLLRWRDTQPRSDGIQPRGRTPIPRPGRRRRVPGVSDAR